MSLCCFSKCYVVCCRCNSGSLSPCLDIGPNDSALSVWDCALLACSLAFSTSSIMFLQSWDVKHVAAMECSTERCIVDCIPCQASAGWRRPHLTFPAQPLFLLRQHLTFIYPFRFEASLLQVLSCFHEVLVRAGWCVGRWFAGAGFLAFVVWFYISILLMQCNENWWGTSGFCLRLVFLLLLAVLHAIYQWLVVNRSLDCPLCSCLSRWSGLHCQKMRNKPWL